MYNKSFICTLDTITRFGIIEIIDLIEFLKAFIYTTSILFDDQYTFERHTCGHGDNYMIMNTIKST